MSKIKIIAILLWFAAINLSAQTYSGGSGTYADPYLISSKADMEALADAVNKGTTYSGKFFRLTQSLTGANALTTTVGKNQPSLPINYFAGVFDGGDFEIELNNAPAGVFGYIRNATIQNLGVRGTISALLTSNDDPFLGGICGWSDNSTIAYCYNTATISVVSYVTNPILTVGYGSGFGGICGVARSQTTITNCFNTGNISDINSYDHNIGGICGEMLGSDILNCYNTGNLSESNSSRYAAYISGICAYAYTLNSSIKNCFSANASLELKYGEDKGPSGRITCAVWNDPYYDPKLSNNYALSSMTMSGDGSTVSSSDASSKDGADASLVNFKSQSWIQSTLGWDFNTVWQMSESGTEFQGLPVLRSSTKPSVQYSIIASAGHNGRILPSGETTVSQGENMTYIFTPNSGFQIYKVLIDGIYNSEAVSSGQYTFTEVSNNHHIIEVFFSPVSPPTFSGGSGTQNAPYLISSKEDMIALADAVEGGTTYEGKYFRLTQNLIGTNAISSSIGYFSEKYAPINNLYYDSGGYSFNGTFDGRGYEIELKNASTGAFGYIKNAAIQNLGVSGSVSGNESYAAGLCACVENSTIAYCYNTATISSMGYSGGICGRAYYNTIINDCFNTGDISGYFRIGGICGEFSGSGSNMILNCYNAGNVSGNISTGDSYIGGISGYLSSTQTQSLISNCFSTNLSIIVKNYDVHPNRFSIGRVVGYDGDLKQSNNYALSTMLVNGSTVSNTDATSQNGADASLANFKSQSWIQSNLGWNFDKVWTMSSSSSEFQGFPVLRAPAPCDNPTASGKTGNLTWTLCPDGTLTISGQGAMPDYDFGNNMAPWISYASSIQTLNIQQGVTSIGNFAFLSCNGLTSVTIPNSVQSIGTSAFLNCSSLTSVTIPNSVQSINSNSFLGCSGLMTINVDAGNSAYSSENGILFNNKKTVLVCYPGGKTGSYSIPNSVTSIGNTAFQSCKGLTSVTIPNSVQSIGEFAFQYCNNLTNVTVDWSTPLSVPSNIFDNVSTSAVTLHIPKNTYNLYAAALVWKDFNIIVQYTITASAGSGGSILPNGDVSVTKGDSKTFTFTPNTGYAIDQVLIDGTNDPTAVSNSSHTFNNVTADHSILVTFKSVPTYTIFSLAGSGGSITPAGNITVTQGNSQKFIFTPNADYEISQVFINGENDTAAVSAGSYTFENVKENHNILVTFTLISAKKYTISASAGNNGNIMPYGNVIVSQGGSQKFTFNPNTDFVIDDVLIDNVSYPSAVATGSYSFTDVTANHTISVTFKPGCLPNAVVQVWNDVLSVVNNSANNGGYTFTSYQWLKDDEEIPGETFGNLYLANDPDRTTAKYTCRVTTSNNQILYTCPLPLTLRALSAYPNPTTGKVIIEGQTLNEGDRIEVYNSTGTLVKQFSANPRQTEINLGNQPKGVYIIKVNGKQMKIIVL